EDRPGEHRDELTLRARGFLIVEPAQDAASGTRVVVLDKRLGDARAQELGASVQLDEASPGVLEDRGLDHDDVRNLKRREMKRHASDVPPQAAPRPAQAGRWAAV